MKKLKKSNCHSVTGNFLTALHTLFRVGIASVLLLSFTHNVSAQELDISFTNPIWTSVCGPLMPLTIEVANNTGADVTNLSGELVLPADIALAQLNSPAVLNGDGTISLGDLADGESITFVADIQAGCARSTDFSYSFNLLSGGSGSETSNPIQVLRPNPSIPSSTPNNVGIYLGQTFTVQSSVANNTFASLDQLIYCVSNSHPAVTLQGITIAGIDITASGPFSSSATQDCYLITSAVIDAAGFGPTLERPEVIVPIETWLVSACVDSPPPILRRAQFGCQGDDDCDNKPQGEFAATNLITDLLATVLTLNILSSSNPACYADEETSVLVRITNSGTAPTKTIRFDLTTAARGMGIVPGSIIVTRDTDGMMVNSTGTGSSMGSGCLAAQTTAAAFELTEVNLGIGESITVAYRLSADCSCNDCDIRNKYYSRLRVLNYTDPCDLQIDDSPSVETARFDAFIQGFPEGPTSLPDGGSGCVSYITTDMQLDWLNGNYPDAYLEAIFTLPCGFDYTPGTFTWTDRDGNSFTPANIDYTDSDDMTDDILTVRFDATDRPPSFAYAGGAVFEFCITTDCGEKPPPAICSVNFYDQLITSQFNFITDPTCAATCVMQKIWKPLDLKIRLTCPLPGNCPPCEGLSGISLDIERFNYGIADNNNDQIPDGSIDLDLIQTDRYVQGDSIKVTLVGEVQNVDPAISFTNGFFVFPFSHGNFTPLGATIEITDADLGITYTCTALSVSPDYINNQIVVNFSPASLAGLGCNIPAGYTFGDGDGLNLCLFYTEKNPITEPVVLHEFAPNFYLSDAGFGQGTEYGCNPLLGRLTQINLYANSAGNGQDFGACELSDITIEYDRYIGGAVLDEFPFEIRPIGLPDRLVFTKPAEFDFRLDAWGLTLTQYIFPEHNIFDGTVPASFFIVNGNQVTFLIGNFLESIGNPEIQPDEGYRVRIFPKLQGNCQSIAQNYQYSYQFFEEVNERIYCTPELSRSIVNGSYRYEGAARIRLRSTQGAIRLCSGDEEVVLRVENTNAPAAENTFFYAQPVGGVTVNRVGYVDGTEIIPNEFGIYELGTLPGLDFREIVVFFTKNTCEESARLDFTAGFSCVGYPETINDALCLDPSSVFLTSARSRADMIVIDPTPAAQTFIDLCDPVTYEVNIISSDLGYLRDLLLSFQLPPNQVYIPGSFEYASPAPSSSNNGMYSPTAIDPTPLGGNRFEIDLTLLDEVLATDGLVGSKDPVNSSIAIRFDVETECGYLSGSRGIFELQGSNSCGDPIPPITRRSGRVFIRESAATLDIDIDPGTIRLNACNMDQTTTGARLTIQDGMSTTVDSIRAVLPPGIGYVTGSYVAGMNAAAAADLSVRVVNGLTILTLPIVTGLGSGDVIEFDFDIMAMDIGQACAVSDLLIQAYSTFQTECNGVICDAGELAGEGLQQIIIQKPTLDFNSIDGSITLAPGSPTAAADFSASLTNFGFVLEAGSSVTVGIYEDVNGNGSFEPTIDAFLYNIVETLTTDLQPGQSITISGTGSIQAGDICSIIGVINPDVTCSCSEAPSFVYRPEIIIDIQTEYDVCSSESITVGPDPIPGYANEWVSLGGSDIANFTDPSVTPAQFNAPPNNSGAPIVLQYRLRTTNAPCFAEDTVSITIAPDIMEVVNINACMGSPYALPSISNPAATNFMWVPSAGLTISPNGRFATVDNVGVSTIYTLTYELTPGCPSTKQINLTAVNCGNTNTALGDTVWFDFDENGLFDPGEPGIEGVTVNLIDANSGTVVSTTVTDADGFYIFDMLPPGNYAVQFVPLPGFVFTSMGDGSNPTLDSNADPATGLTPGNFLEFDEQDFTYDAGFIPDCSLEVFVVAGPCIENAAGTDLTRQYTVSVAWENNPYTYDQFGDGEDIIEVDFMGTTYFVTAAELMGTAVAATVFSDDAGPFTATAAFQEATACSATAEVGPVIPCTYDLAFQKVASTINETSPPYAYGDLLCMDLIVVNQGLQPVTNVQVRDVLPAGLAFNAVESADFIDLVDYELAIIAGPIQPGQSSTVTLCANIVMVNPPTADSYVNVAEIRSFSDLDGNDVSAFDEDSTPDDDPTNDPGGNFDNDSDDALNGDGTGTAGDPNVTAANDEDDQDGFQIEVFDLALTKTLVTPGPYEVGQEVTYEIRVINQGSVTAANIEVTDYLPTGVFIFDPANPDNSQWNASIAPGPPFDLITADIPGTLAPAAEFTLMITLTIAPVPPMGTLLFTNLAEISAATDEAGNDADDFDGSFDQNPNNDAGGTPNSAADDAINGDGTGPINGTDAATDEDNHDPASLFTEGVSIGSTVFFDLNNNGLQDTDDVGLPDVVVELISDANGNGMIDIGENMVIASTMTDPDGNYFFSGLFPGNYVVQISMVNFNANGALSQSISSSAVTDPADNQEDGDDNGTQTGPGQVVTSGVITLAPGEEPTGTDENFQGGTADDQSPLIDANGDMTIDFGFAPNVSIGSTLFADYNDNGMQDAGEPGIPNVVIYLYYDMDGSGTLNGPELTPIDTAESDGMGDYLFAGLAPGAYLVEIPLITFQTGGGLEFLTMSSTDIATTVGDNQTDGDDNGIQFGGSGMVVRSSLISLFPGDEPLDDGAETAQDFAGDPFDASGDQTIDFGFVCDVQVTIDQAVIDLCSSKILDLTSLAVITPASVDGTWTTSGDGLFLDNSGNPVTPASFSQVVAYAAGTSDSNTGTVTLTLTTQQAGLCPPVSNTIEIDVKKVGCGTFPWNGQ